MLFGGITLGAFSPNWSDVDLIVWVNPGEVTPHLRERALYLWNHLAERPLGTLLYLYVAPMTVLGGPMNVAGGGVPGQPSSLRVYRHKARWMEGYPLSLPDTVSLRRYGAVLAGRDVRSDLPEVPDDWPVVYLRERLEQLIRAVSAQVGPYGPDVAKAARVVHRALRRRPAGRSVDPHPGLARARQCPRCRSGSSRRAGSAWRP